MPNPVQLFRKFRELRARAGTVAAVARTVRFAWLRSPARLRRAAMAARAWPLRAAIRRRRAGAGPVLAVAVTGGLGDLIVIARFLRDLFAGGEATFDVYAPAPARAAWIFAAVPGFRAAYAEVLFDSVCSGYDVALRANQTVTVRQENLRPRALHGHPRLAAALADIVKASRRFDVLIDRHPFLDNQLARIAVLTGQTRATFLHHLAGLGYGGDALALSGDAAALARAGVRVGHYITIHNGFDPDFAIGQRRATKCYPYFGAVVAQLRRDWPQARVVQIGLSATSEALAEADLNLLDRTSLAEVTALLRGALFHIDNEGGLVHLARAVGTRAAVVFGPTPGAFFGYPGNLNLDPPTCGDCWWLSPTWMERCLRGDELPRCMARQAPQDVAGRILRWADIVTAPSRASVVQEAL